MDTFVGILFIIVCVLLIIIVLLQKGRGGGLGAAFGGAGSSAFGTRTGDVFTWVTIVLTGLFLLLAIGATLLHRPDTGKVMTPTLDPAEGPITGAMEKVYIRCDTAESRIAFTTDGSEPKEEDAADSQSVVAEVKAGDTLKVRAFRENWRSSDLVVVTYERAKAPKTQPATSKPATRPTTTPTTVPAPG